VQQIVVEVDGRFEAAEADLPPVTWHVSVRRARRMRTAAKLRRVAELPPGTWVEVRLRGRARGVPIHRCHGLMLEQLELWPT